MGSYKFRARVYDAGSTGTSTSNVDFTPTLASVPVVRHPTVLPLTGRTEAQPWTLNFVDDGSSFTANLSDSSGRLDMLNRLVVVDRSTDGGSNDQLKSVSVAQKARTRRASNRCSGFDKVGSS